MRKLVLSAAAMTAVSMAAGATAMLGTAGADGDGQLKATLVDANGSGIGSAKISFKSGDAEVRVELQLPPAMAGFHGFHVHAVGQCVAPFTTAGGHLGEVAGDHSHRHRNHDGDLPVLLVKADGTASARVSTDRIDVAELRDADGSAFIIHAAPDNYANIPTTDPANGNGPRYANPNAVPVYPNATTDELTLRTGDAGGRVACGVIR